MSLKTNTLALVFIVQIAVLVPNKAEAGLLRAMFTSFATMSGASVGGMAGLQYGPRIARAMVKYSPKSLKEMIGKSEQQSRHTLESLSYWGFCGGGSVLAYKLTKEN